VVRNILPANTCLSEREASSMLATATNGTILPISGLRPDLEHLSTLPDPRSSHSSVDVSRSNSTHHPELSTEVATLSNKLISAINHQTTLDDSLSTTRHELDSSRERVRQLEAALQQHRDMIASGVLVRKIDIEHKTLILMANLADEKEQRGAVEKDKRGIEQELESLTTALFEEANQVLLLSPIHVSEIS
jgi:Rab guanine nucleotide exchange factor SEC2